MITKVRHSFGTIETQPLFNLLITSLVRNHKFKRYTSKFFVSAEGLISCYLSSFTVCVSLHFLLCQKIHYFFKMPRFCSVIITHFSFTVTASFLSKKVRTSVSQSVSQSINRSINQSINQSICSWNLDHPDVLTRLSGLQAFFSRPTEFGVRFPHLRTFFLTQ